MAYTPTNWKDRVVEKPRTYRMQDNGDGTITLIPEPGTIYEPGTPVNAVNLNKLENGLQAAAAVADSAMPKSGGQFTGYVRTAASAGNIGDSGSSGINFEVSSGSNNDDAFMAFHVPNNFAFKFGIDRATKRLAVGGWSLGANKYKLWDERDLRVNDGVLEFFDGGAWKPVGFDPRTMELNSFNHFAGQIIVGAKSYSDILTVNGKGVLSEFVIYVFAPSNSEKLGVSLVTDGNEVPLYIYDNISGSAVTPVVPGGSQFNQTNAAYTRIVEFNSLAAYESSLIIRLRNEFGFDVGNVQVALRGVYYT